MKIKKIIATAMSFVIVGASFTSMNLLSASAATISTSLSTTKTGDTIKVDVKLSSSVTMSYCNVTVSIGKGFDYVNSANSYDLGTGFNASSSALDDRKLVVVEASSTGDVSVKQVLTFYIKANTNLTSSNNKITVNVDAQKANGSDISITGMTNTALSTSYKRGDVNADKSVDSRDAVAIKKALSDHRISKASVSVLNEGYLSDWFPLISSAEAADANVDGYVTDADAEAILAAYSQMLLNSYDGTIGKTYTVTIK